MALRVCDLNHLYVVSLVVVRSVVKTIAMTALTPTPWHSETRCHSSQLLVA